MDANNLRKLQTLNGPPSIAIVSTGSTFSRHQPCIYTLTLFFFLCTLLISIHTYFNFKQLQIRRERLDVHDQNTATRGRHISLCRRRGAMLIRMQSQRAFCIWLMNTKHDGGTVNSGP